MLWEAQFGDFANGAQTIIDQFISSGLAKWKQTSRLTLLLPHGYEGNGPEHSSARLERFLQLAAQENIRIANCTTAAQYFHLLRRQALDAERAAARRDDAEGPAAAEGRGLVARRARRRRFQPLLDAVDPDKEAVRRLVLCSGKIYYDIVGHERGAPPTRHRGRPRRAALPVPGRGGPRADRVVPERSTRSSGRRRSRRTWARGARSATGSRRRPPGVPGALRRPAVAREHGRGLPDRAPARAGADRARRARAESSRLRRFGLRLAL